MDKPKKTGLGTSFLFQRTEPSEPSRLPDAPDVSSVPAISGLPDVSDAPSAQPVQTPERVRRPKRSQREKAIRKVPRDKCTLHIDRDVNERLDLAARIEGRERSEVVSELLRRNLPSYRVERE